MMTDPAEIAAKLTPAQIGALRGGRVNEKRGHISLVRFELEHNIELINVAWGKSSPTPLGRAVLAALDAKEAGNG